MDTKYLHEALRNWQERNHDSRTWDKLSQAERSAIMRDAQDIKDDPTKRSAEPLTIDEVLDASRRSRQWRL